MYDLYLAQCVVKKQKQVKMNVYRDVFNSDFNISFNQPKKDRCDLCEQFAVAERNENMTMALMNNYDEHCASKQST